MLDMIECHNILKESQLFRELALCTNN